MSTPITIRASTESDIPALTELLAELNREEGYETSIEPAALAQLLFGNDKRTLMRALIAECDGKTLGLALYYWGFDTVSSSYGYHLADIIVTKSARRGRIGKQLMQTLAAQCLSENGQWISLTALKENTVAKKFYTAMRMSQVLVDFYAIGPQALAQLKEMK